jgi:IPT/TIG domain
VSGQPRLSAARGASATLLILTAFFAISCGKNPNGPSNGLQVAGVSPGSGTTLGGTAVTITGSGFSGTATVTIGGAPATNVAITSDTTITALTPQHATGAADVSVSAGGKSGTLHNGYSYSAPSRQDNQPPVIAGITALGTRGHEPKNFADLDEVINVTAAVSDDTTSPDQLDYQWSAPAGGFDGTGAAVRWHAPHAAGSVDLTLTVVEKYQTTDDSGLPVSKENRTTQTVTIGVHDSAGEVGDMASTFMLEFSQQNPGPSQILRNFSDSCAGKKAENDDISNNQKNFVIQSYKLDPATVTVNFAGSCRYTDHGTRNGDACAYVGATWRSFDKLTNRVETAQGTDQLAAIFDGSRWWLCNSDFFAPNSLTTMSTGMVPGRVR